ncbi:transposase [Methylacidimicrobium sp. B4]|uniref:transposase n=1 Tax=Methylacidimicrobium sp. B4 TaxID=2796139 RepID=UPI001F5E01A7|nr:transposase [Methylacidimicrobium sp. B4]
MPKRDLGRWQTNEWTRSKKPGGPASITHGIIEASHGRIQLAKGMARGFRSFRYLRIAAFLKAGKLRLDLPALPT